MNEILAEQDIDTVKLINNSNRKIKKVPKPNNSAIICASEGLKVNINNFLEVINKLHII